jgi:hypothetical protein
MRQCNFLIKSSGRKSRPARVEQTGRTRVLPFTGRPGGREAYTVRTQAVKVRHR